jgi:hypothetical protein
MSALYTLSRDSLSSIMVGGSVFLATRHSHSRVGLVFLQGVVLLAAAVVIGNSFNSAAKRGPSGHDGVAERGALISAAANVNRGLEHAKLPVSFVL